MVGLPCFERMIFCCSKLLLAGWRVWGEAATFEQVDAGWATSRHRWILKPFLDFCTTFETAGRREKEGQGLCGTMDHLSKAFCRIAEVIINNNNNNTWDWGEVFLYI